MHALLIDAFLAPLTATHYRPSSWYMVHVELVLLLALSALSTLDDYANAGVQAAKTLATLAALGAARALPFTPHGGVREALLGFCAAADLCCQCGGAPRRRAYKSAPRCGADLPVI